MACFERDTLPGFDQCGAVAAARKLVGARNAYYSAADNDDVRSIAMRRNCVHALVMNGSNTAVSSAPFG